MEPKTELQEIAIDTARKKELNVYQRAIDMQLLNTRMYDSGMARCLALIQREADMEKEYQERTDHAAIVNASAEKETLLGLEVSKIKREEACKLLRRHYLRKNDPALQNFIKKLERGYTCRDLKVQILNNEYKRLQEQAVETNAQKVLNEALLNDAQEKYQKEKEKLERTSEYCAELQQQMVNKQQQRYCQYEDTLIEKKMLDDIIKTMYDEDVREREKKKELTDSSRQDMITSQKAKTAWKEKQKALVIKEEREIEKQKRMLADRTTAILEERKRKEQQKEEINFRISEKIRIEKEERDERANIVTLLQEQEYLEQNINDEISGKEKADRMKREMKIALTEQMNTRRQEAERAKIRDEQYRIQVQKEISKADAKEQEKERLKKEKQKQYTVELMQQMEESRRQRRNLREDELARSQAVLQFNQQWDEEVKKERERITEEHAPRLLGYLQAGTLKKSDIPALKRGIETKPELRHLNLDALGKDVAVQRRPKCNAQCRVIREY